MAECVHRGQMSTLPAKHTPKVSRKNIRNQIWPYFYGPWYCA